MIDGGAAWSSTGTWLRSPICSAPTGIWPLNGRPCSSVVSTVGRLRGRRIRCLRGHRFTERVPCVRSGQSVPDGTRHLQRRLRRADDLVFRVLLFKLFNRIDTWEHLGLRSASRRWRPSIPSPIRVGSIVGSPPTNVCTPRRTSCRAHNSATTASTPTSTSICSISSSATARLAEEPPDGSHLGGALRRSASGAVVRPVPRLPLHDRPELQRVLRLRRNGLRRTRPGCAARRGRGPRVDRWA